MLAMQEGSLLLTGGKALRKAASQEGVEVHGTLWLLDAMVEVERSQEQRVIGRWN